MSWRLAKALGHLRDQFDQMAPNRNKSWDGTIGDQNHAARTSDHNPDSHGVVHALDITHDPAHGVDTYDIADQIRRTHDRRIRYIISNRRIAGGPSYASRNGVTVWEWHHYSGSNPHDHHFHTSVESASADDTGDWKFNLSEPKGRPEVAEAPLRVGSKGDRVSYLQGILKIKEDGDFGAETERFVKIFQTAHHLVADGIVGVYTWKALLDPTAPVTPEGPAPVVSSLPMSGKGSWYSQYRGKHVWKDSGDKPGSAALGVADEDQGISFYDWNTLGKWFQVQAPNGSMSIEQQTDFGPSPWTGKKIDISAAAAERFGYSPENFPTGGIFRWKAIEVPTKVAKLSMKEQAKEFYKLRSEIA